jgi:hypothetical protein
VSAPLIQTTMPYKLASHTISGTLAAESGSEYVARRNVRLAPSWNNFRRARLGTVLADALGAALGDTAGDALVPRRRARGDALATRRRIFSELTAWRRRMRIWRSPNAAWPITYVAVASVDI